MSRTTLFCFVLVLLLSVAVYSHAAKKVVVLYFEDHSGFDTSSGCGCLPMGPLSFLFGRGGHHVDWDLATGFRDLTIEALNASPYYETASFDELVVAMAEEDITFQDLKKSKDKRTLLADKLKADVLLVGELEEFYQERLQGSHSQSLRYDGRSSVSATGGVQALGYYYRAGVEIDLKLFNALGEPLSLSKVKGIEVYQLAGVNISPFRAVTTNRGSELAVGSARFTDRIERPIINYEELNRIKFASPEYHRTLFGMATNKAMDNLILTLQERIGPAPGSIVEAAPMEGLTAKIIYVNGTEAYINVGSAEEIQVGQQMQIIKPVLLQDPDTDEPLGTVNQTVGTAKVVEVRTDRLSQIQILDNEVPIEKGHVVEFDQGAQGKSEPPAAPEEAQSDG